MTTGTRKARRPASFLAGVIVAAGIVLIASAAWAVIPDASGTIHACVAARDGALRVIDTDAGQQCKRTERELTWNTAPGVELPDAFITLRTAETQVEMDSRTTLAVLDLQPGLYEVTGKVFLFNPNALFTRGVGCELEPSTPDGSPDQARADNGAAILAPAGEPGNADSIPLAVSETLSVPGRVILSCRTVPETDVGTLPIASYSWIRAIEVGTITEDDPVGNLP